MASAKRKWTAKSIATATGTRKTRSTASKTHPCSTTGLPGMNSDISNWKGKGAVIVSHQEGSRALTNISGMGLDMIQMHVSAYPHGASTEDTSANFVRLQFSASTCWAPQPGAAACRTNAGTRFQSSPGRQVCWGPQVYWYPATYRTSAGTRLQAPASQTQVPAPRARRASKSAGARNLPSRGPAVSILSSMLSSRTKSR